MDTWGLFLLLSSACQDRTIDALVCRLQRLLLVHHTYHNGLLYMYTNSKALTQSELNDHHRHMM